MRRLFVTAGLMLVACAIARAQTPPADRLEIGTAGLDIAPAKEVTTVAPRVVTAIGETMLREPGARRLRMARDLGECRSPAALPYLRKMLADPDALMRAQGAASIGAIGDPTALKDVQPLLGDAMPQVRREAVLACAALGDDQAAAAALKDADATVVAAAIQASRGGDAIARQLIGLAPPLRVQAIRRLGRLASRGHAAAVGEFLKSDSVTRIAAVESLTAMNATDHAEAVRALLRDEHPGVRRAATSGLSLTAAPADRAEHAIAMLADTEPEVRQAAAEILAKNPTPEALAPLAQQLDDGDEPLRLAARDALVALKEPALDVAAKLLTDADPRRREDGSYILGHLRSDTSLAAHIALLKDADWPVVRQAAWSLGRIGRPQAGEALEDIVRGIPKTASSLPVPQQQACAAAVVAATQLGVRSTVDHMAQLIRDLAPTPTQASAVEIRSACIWGFGLLGSAENKRTCDALPGIVEEMLEQGEPKIEAVKALGHLRYKPATGAVKRLAEESFDPTIRWMACWAHERITGQSIAYTPPVHSRVPELSISDLPR